MKRCTLPLIGHLCKNQRYVVQADYTWINGCLELKKHIHINEFGRIVKILCSSEYIPETHGQLFIFPGKALFPGMINSHSHAFQRGLRGRGEIYPVTEKLNSFWTWREEMYKLVKTMDKKSFYDLSFLCFEEMLRSGITCVGEFHYFHHEKGKHNYAYDEIVLKAAKDVGIRFVLLNTFYKYGGFNEAVMSEAQERFKTIDMKEYWKQMDYLKKKLDQQIQSLGVVAHSLRAISLSDIIHLHEESRKRGLVFHMHLEEQPKEIQDCQKAFGKNPLRLVLDNLKVDSKFTAVHCTWSNDEEMKEFIQKGGNVCICPLTEGNLGDGFPSLSLCIPNVCIGTDCNARIDMLEELRWLEYAHRLKQNRRGICATAAAKDDIGKLLFQFATINGAKALDVSTGVIEEGRFADFMLIDLNHSSLKGWTKETLLTSLIFGCGAEQVVSNVCINGRWKSIVRDQEQDNEEDKSKKRIKLDPTVLEAQKLSDPQSDDVVSLALALINTPSTSGNENDMAYVVKEWLEHRGWKVQLQEVETSSTSRFNVFAKRPGVENPKILFNTHLDTVPPYFPARIDQINGYIYGRGACDTKSILAAQLIAATRCVNRGLNDIGLLFVVSEETDHSGMKKAVKLGLNPDGMIVGEPTGMKLMTLQKGILKLQLISRGISAHSGYPHKGKSAIDPIVDVLHSLQHHSWPSHETLGKTTLNVGLIEGGQAANALAEECTAVIMFRIIQPPEQLLELVQNVVDDRVEIKVLSQNPPVKLGSLSGYPTDVACFNTDIPYFEFGSKQGQAYLFGPGDICDAHSPREYIRIEDLKRSIDIYFQMAFDILKEMDKKK